MSSKTRTIRLYSWLIAIVTLCTMAIVVGRVVRLRAAEPPSEVKGVRVLVAAHSFCVPMAEPMTAIAKAAGFADHELVDTQFIPGSSVTQHWELAEKKNVAKRDILAGKVDVLVLSPNTVIPDPAIEQFTALLLAQNPNGRVFIYEPWLPFDGRFPTGNIPSLKRNERTTEELLRLHETWKKALDTQISKINAGYPRQVVYTIPAAPALFILRGKVHEGKVPGITTQDALFTDAMGHPTPVLVLLGAYVEYATIYGKSPVDIPYPAKLPKIDPVLNRQLQEIAWEAVTGDPLAGVTAEKR